MNAVAYQGMPQLGTVDPIKPATSPISSPATVEKSGGPDFAEVFGDALAKAGGAERAADENAAKFAAGDPGVGIHESVIAAEKANIALRFTVTLKNKALEAYRELMNTNI